MTSAARKRSCTVTCPSSFRDAVEGLAATRGANAADIARSVLLLVPRAEIEAFADPGEPARDDRETVVLKSGPGAGRPWRRKPRLQVRLPGDPAPSLVRRALALALALAAGSRLARIDEPGDDARRAEAARRRGEEDAARRWEDRADRLRAAVAALSFEPLPGGVASRAEALHVLGFPPGARPDARAIRARFRTLATIHHPDGELGSHTRMSQLNAAMDLLR